jgi:hypothetical protein
LVKRPPLTKKERKEREALREASKGKTTEMGLYSIGNRGQPIQRYTEEYAMQVAKDMLEWCEREDSLFINEFAVNYKEYIPKDQLKVMADRYDVFKCVLQKVKQILTIRLDKLAIDKKIDSNFYSKIKPLHDQEYREWMRELAGIESDKNSKQEIHVTITPGGKLAAEDSKTIDHVQGGE